MKKLIFSVAVIITLFASCGSSHRVNSVKKPAPINLTLGIVREPRANSFVNLDYGIRLSVYDGRSNQSIMMRYDANPIFVPEVNAYPPVMDFIKDNTKRYMKTLGFTMDSDIDTDYLLLLNVQEFNLNYFSGIGWSANVSLNVEVEDGTGKKVYPNVPAKGTASRQGDAGDHSLANQVMNTAWTNALEDIDWARIAYFLKKSQSAAQEKNKKVAGMGNTALESTVINWSITSAPKGADINWRVVSSTPDVKNTNSKYLGTTPFESTETFDIIGLTYNNSGNVQIEVTCEKAGYHEQKKRFNLRSVIDSKEISTKFNLVKEDQ